MAKRFVDPDLYKRQLRGCDPKIRLAFHWLWENSDAAGVWVVDLDLFRFELGYALNIEALTKACPWIKVLANGSLFLVDFVPLNYGTLKPEYNPHKPVFRSLTANSIDPLTLTFQGLPKACPSLEEEEEGEGKGEGYSGKERAREPEIAEAVLWPTFKDWFDLYAKRRDMGECQAIWARLDQATHELIYRHTEAYVKAQPDKLYRKDPIRYLKKKGWLDEIITPSTNGTNNGRRSTDPADAARRTAEYFANKRAGQPVEPTGNT